MISTRSLQGLPDIGELDRVARGLAALDAILCEEWELRYYSYNRRWDPAGTARMASMRDGSGDDLFMLFTAAGVVIKGFAHDSPMGWTRPGVKLAVQRGLELVAGALTGFPDELAEFLVEPAFKMHDTSFIVWRQVADDRWHVGDVAWPAPHPDPDGSAVLLSPYAGRPADYVAYAAEYFEKTLAVADVAQVLALAPLDDALLARLGCERSLRALRDDLDEIGYAFD